MMKYVSAADCAECAGHSLDVFRKFLMVTGPIPARVESIRSRRSNWHEKGHDVDSAVSFMRQHCRSFGSQSEGLCCTNRLKVVLPLSPDGLILRAS